MLGEIKESEGKRRINKEELGTQPILIVDDLPANIIALKAVLKGAKYTVDTALSGKEAIEKALNNTYALILLDAQMPELDGFEVAKILKSNDTTKEFPIIFLTALGSDVHHIKKALSAGAIDYISKPLDTEVLLLKIRNHFINFKQQQELIQSKEYLFDLSISLEKKKEYIQDSINYANLIQRGIFPSIESLEIKFKDSYIICEPKDTIGGDFYWMDKLNNRIITICADCTGHGVPGAMLSMIGFQALSEIISNKRVFDPGEILTQLHHKVKALLSSESGLLPHGMDVSVCVYREEDGVLEYACAKRLLLIESEGVLLEFKGEPFSIGDDTVNDFKYTTYYHNVEAPSWLFQFSDGVQDQFGGPRDKKFGKLQLKQVLLDNIQNTAMEQKSGLKNVLDNWKGGKDQTDDITFMGIQLLPV